MKVKNLACKKSHFIYTIILGIAFNQLYPRQTENWPHAILIEPKTGIKLDQWEGKSVFDDCESFLTVLTKSIRSNTNNVIPSVTSKKRSHENIIDQVRLCESTRLLKFCRLG